MSLNDPKETSADHLRTTGLAKSALFAACRPELGPKEGEYFSIELLVEDDAVEARRVRAYLRNSLGQCRRADDEGEVYGVRHQMILVLCRQILVHGGHALLRYPVAAKFGSPQLNRGLHGGQALGGKEKAAERVSNDGGPEFADRAREAAPGTPFCGSARRRVATIAGIIR